jgi:hypothetical protein
MSSSENKPSRGSVVFWLTTAISLPFLLLFFLGEILATPLASRRHDSTAWWLLFTVVRFIGPAIIVGISIAYLIRYMRHT